MFFNSKIFFKIKDLSRNIKYLTQIKQKSDNTLVKQAYLHEINHSQNRISIENTSKIFNDNLRTLNKEIDIYQLSEYKRKQYIITIYCEKWKNMLSNSSKADRYSKVHQNLKNASIV